MIKKKKLIVGNWKMNPGTAEEARTIFSGIQKKIAKVKNVESVICPPLIYIHELVRKLGGNNLSIGAQNIFEEPKGSFTGEASAAMLKNLGVTHCIIGHSERRTLGETDELVNKKIILALSTGLMPIVCIGEETRDEEGQYLGHIKSQLEKALSGVRKKHLDSLIIAYEPIWAIGATEAMSARDVHEMTIFIKKCLVDMYNINISSAPRILYGGSVDPLNAGGILSQGEADGLLIGRQSLSAESFGEILKIASEL